MRPVHHQRLLPVDEWHYLQHFQLVADFVDLVSLSYHQRSTYQQHQSQAFEQIQPRQLGHRIVRLDEPDQLHLLQTVPLGPLYLLRRRMI